MWSNRKSRRRSLEPEATLRSYRAEPREEFVKSLAQRVATRRLGPTPHGLVTPGIRRCGLDHDPRHVRLVRRARLCRLRRNVDVLRGQERRVDQKLNVDVRKSSASAQYDTEPAPPPQQNVAPASETQGAAAAAIGEADTLPFTGISCSPPS